MLCVGGLRRAPRPASRVRRPTAHAPRPTAHAPLPTARAPPPPPPAPRLPPPPPPHPPTRAEGCLRGRQAEHEILVRERREHVRRLMVRWTPVPADLRSPFVLAQTQRRHQILE